MSYKYGTVEWEETFERLMRDMLASESKPYIMGTPSWILAYEELIQNDATYRELAKDWEGSVVIHILAAPDVGLEDDMFLFIDLWHGDCRSVRLVPTSVGENGDYVLTATYDRWKQVMQGQLDTTKALMQGKIKLKGELTTIVRYSKAATRLAELVGMVDTIFLDEMTPEEIEAFKPWVEFIKSEYEL